MYSFPTVESALLFVSYLDKNPRFFYSLLDTNNSTLKGTRKKKLQKLGHTSVSHTSSSFSFRSGISLRAGSLRVLFAQVSWRASRREAWDEEKPHSSRRLRPHTRTSNTLSEPARRLLRDNRENREHASERENRLLCENLTRVW